MYNTSAEITREELEKNKIKATRGAKISVPIVENVKHGAI